MFKIFVLIIVSAVMVTVNTEEELPDKPGYCRIGNVYIKEGEQGPSPIGTCSRVHCDNAKPGSEAYTEIGCGTFVERPGCTQSEYDNTRQYPRCCPREVCPDDLKNNL